jgi:CRISPR/Cas system-associated endonuclease Cas1
MYGRASLTSDLMEVYRFLIDDFLIGFCKSLDRRDFTLREESYQGRKGKRAFLCKQKNNEFLDKLEEYFQKKVRKGKRQEIETLINEEAFLLARYIRTEKETWTPRVPELA